MNSVLQKTGASSGDGWLEGRVLGKYKLLEHVGSGAFASIYKAVHQHLPIFYAVKVLHPAFAKHEEVVERFFREAQASSQLQHKNIVFIADFAFDEEVGPYIVMEYLEGETLAERLSRGGALSLKEIGEIGYQVCNALDLVHRKGIVHRDLKPDNIFLSERELGRLQVKIFDFGIAHLEQANESITGVRLLGTPIYMAPEQFEGVIHEPSLDLYAFGVILFEMLTGAPPYQGRNMHQLGIEHLLQKVPDLDPALFPESLCDLQRELLAKSPGERPQTMGEVHLRLVEAIDPEHEMEHWHMTGLPSREMPRVSLGDVAANAVFESVKPTVELEQYPEKRTEQAASSNDRPTQVSQTAEGVVSLHAEKSALQSLLPEESVSPSPAISTETDVEALVELPEDDPTSEGSSAEDAPILEGTDPRIPVNSPEFSRKTRPDSTAVTPIEVVRSQPREDSSPSLRSQYEQTLQRLDKQVEQQLAELLSKEGDELSPPPEREEQRTPSEDGEYVFSEEELRAIQEEAEMLVEEEDIFAKHGDTVLYKMPQEEKPLLQKVLAVFSLLWKKPRAWMDELRDQMTPRERKYLLFVWLAVAMSVAFSLLWILYEMLTSGG